MSEELDDTIRAAAKAHEALVAADYFDGLSARVLARLAASGAGSNEVSMMSDTTNGNDPSPGAMPPPTGTPSSDRVEDSGLHDIKSLAQTAKHRISRRITSQHDALAHDESLLASSQSGLRAVALPTPAQLVSLPELPGAHAAATIGTASAAADVTPIGAAPARRKTALYVAIGGVLAAAAAAVVLITSGGGKPADPQATADQGAAMGSQIAAGPSARTAEGLATGSGAASSAGSGATGSTAVVAAADPGTAAALPPVAPTATGGAPGGAGPTADSPDRKDERAAAPDKVSAGAGSAASDKGGADKGTAGKKPGGDKAAGGAGDKAAGGGDKAAGGGDKAAGGDKAGGGEKSIEDLLDEASGGAQKPKGDDSGGGEIKPEKTGLDGKDIKAGMGAVKGAAQACFDQHGVAGLVKVKAVVDSSGKVTKAEATGEFAGSPTGACVAAAVKGASFASWTGGPMTISYGFTLQE